MPRHLNVARVVLDNPLPHLDRLFDYEIPEELDEVCVPGVKVKVKFSNRNMEAWVVEKVALSSHHKKLSEISKVISNYPVLTPEVLTLSQIVADRFIGNLTDVLRFAIPPRQAKIEKAFKFELVKSLNTGAKGDVALSSVTIPPCVDKDEAIIDSVKKTIKKALILKESGVKVQVLSAEQEPSVRYSSFLEILGSNADVVIGTRNAVFAPLQNLGLIAIWDDADENYFSQQTPYWNAREVAILRARLNACDFMSFGNCESVATNQLIKDKAIIRVPFIDSDSKNYWPQVFTLDNSSSDPIERTKRIPNKAWELVKEGLKSGNVLIQVPRLGYSSNLQCSSCRESARCNGCSGPLLTKQKNSAPECKWCGKVASSWRCRYCNTREFRISVVGQTKTVEELGKSFPGVNILTSGGATILRNVEESNSIIVATPGAEPKTPNGYSSAILLDAYLLLGVPSLAASEEALRKWLHLFTLLKPESDGGKVFITSESTNRVVQALIKHDPNWLINNEQELRTETKLHPSVTTISLKGDLIEINQLLETFNDDASISVMGPRIFEKEELAQIVIGTSKPEDIISKVRSEIIKFSVARTKPVRAHVNAYDID
jgi:primosomal protein N' (replication factor Y)